MSEFEISTLSEKSLFGDGVIKVLRGIKNRWAVEKLCPELRHAAQCIAEGKASLLPGLGVYVVLLDGNNGKIVEEMRVAKGRRPEQREATVVPPKKLFELVDFPLLKELNPRITKKVITDMYRVHPCGLILPCREEVVPERLITPHRINGREIPTIMNIWLARYRIFKILWEQISRYPDVLLAGSSANLTGLNSPLTFDEAYPYLSAFVASAVRDPGESDHFYKGSHTVFNLIKNPVEKVRDGSVHSEHHPKEYQKFIRIFS